MAILTHGMVQKSLQEIFQWIERRELALPELQRPSVWGESKIPRLLSSVYHDYPFGILLIWSPRPKERIQCRAFKFDKREQRESIQPPPLHFLIDGQQRLTSFYRALHEDGDVQVLINVRKEDFELQNKKYSEKDGWYPVKHLLGMNDRERIKFRDEQLKTQPDVTEKHLLEVFDRLDRLRPEKMQITFFVVYERPYADVAEIFERINLGTPVTRSQIVLGKLSLVLPGVVQEVETYLAHMKEQHGNEFDLDLFMNVLAVTALQYADVEELINRYQRNGQGVNGKGGLADPVQALTQDLDRAKSSLEHAFRFTDKYLHIDTMRYFPSERTLAVLAYLFSKYPTYLDEDSKAWQIGLWTLRALVMRRHSDQRDMRHDIRIVREGEGKLADLLLSTVKDGEVAQKVLQLKDLESPISRNNEFFGILYSMLRWKGAVSWITKDFRIATHVESDKRLDIHHIYPAAQIERERMKDGRTWKEEWRDDIGNLTFLLWQDNEQLRDPHISYLRDPRFRDVLGSHLINGDRPYGDDHYERFLKDRRLLMYDGLRQYLSYLELQGRTQEIATSNDREAMA